MLIGSWEILVYVYELVEYKDRVGRCFRRTMLALKA